MRQSMNVFISAASILCLLLFYQNCTPSDTSTNELSSTFSTALTLEPCETMEKIFSRTYRPFLQKNCQGCHKTGGVGKGAFGDSSLQTGWSAFELAGYTRISDFAVNPGHNSPFTGAQHQKTISNYRQFWVTGLEEQVRCKNTDSSGDDNIGSRFNTSQKSIGITNIGGTKTLEWTLSSELSAGPGLTLPQLPGAKLSVDIELVQTLGQVAYYINNPRIEGSRVDINLNSIRTKINGQYIPGETTFTFVNKNIYKNTNTLLSAGTMIALGKNNSADTLQLSIGNISVANLPPPDLGPEVSFEFASQTHAESGVAQLTVNLSREPSQAVIVQIEFDKATTGKLRRSQRSEEDPYDHFDWDFTLGAVATPASNRTLTFVPGNGLSQTIDVLVSDDQRDEPEEQAVLSIINVENGVVGTNKKHTIRVADDDAPPANPFVKTFSELMNGNGVLSQRCLECHNTVLKEGGYDMTDYTSLVSIEKQILIPGNPTLSQMYQRIRLEGPGRMPLDQSLDPGDQRLIENWILDGAKNN